MMQRCRCSENAVIWLMHRKMKSLRTKGRSKKNERLGKFLVNGTSRPDLSNLRKPIDTSVSDLHQVSRLLEDGTDEVQSILSYECNIIYECRICHSLFRSIVNFVSHKREYCKEKFNITLHGGIFNNHNMHSARESIIRMYKTDRTSNDDIKNDRILRSQVPKETNKKDLTAIIDMLNKRREEDIEVRLENENVISNTRDESQIYLEAIDTNCSAVYQTIKSPDIADNALDLMKEQITKLQNMTDENAFELERQMSESQLEKSDSPIQANTSDEENELLIYRLPMNDLSCSICNARFSTKKTLTVHVKTLHTSKRLYYPCPCCTNTFANTWSVYRHLYKVHKKTNEQVRKLRPQIQEKAFHRETTAMKDIENVRAIKVSALKNVMENNDTTQESISYIESNTNFSDRRLNKKVHLSTYLKCCQTPIAACDKKTIKIKQCNNIPISTSDNILCETKDVNLAVNTIIKPFDDKNISSKNSEHISSLEICDREISSRVQNVSSRSKQDWDMLDNQYNYLSERKLMDNNDSDVTSPQIVNNSKSMSSTENQDNFVPNENLKSSGIKCTDINEVNSAASKMRNKKEKVLNNSNEKQLIDLKERGKVKVEEDNSKLQSSCFSSPYEKTPTSLMESKVATFANFRKLRCLLCRRKFTSVPNLRRHMAMHIGWNRYRCKSCNFKCFVKCDCISHCNKMHNMQNNRAAIAEMVLEIPEDEYTSNKDVITNVLDLKTKSNNYDVTDITVSSSQPETRADSNDSSDLTTHIILRSEATATKQVVESHGSVERLNIDMMDSDNTVRMQGLSEDVMKGKNLDDPELKRMVMEVIFGSSDMSLIKQADFDESALETSDDVHGSTDANDNVNSANIDKSKQAYPILDNVKHQRPTRNRVRLLNEDFIYDLKKMSHRKESAVTNDSEILHIRKKPKLYNC